MGYSAWSILYVSGKCLNNTLDGKVKANKIISSMQRVGFPIDIKFNKADMGPHSLTIDSDATKLQAGDCIEIIEQEIKEYENNRIDIHLLDKGEDIFKNIILSTLDGYPRAELLEIGFKNQIASMFNKKGNELVEETHKDLGWEKPITQLKAEFDEIIENLILQADEQYDESCILCETVLGTLEFSQRTLHSSTISDLRKKEVGYRHIFFNLELLLKTLNLNSKNHSKIHENEDWGSDALFNLSTLIHSYCYAIERNALVYEIKKPVETIDGEFKPIIIAW